MKDFIITIIKIISSEIIRIWKNLLSLTYQNKKIKKAILKEINNNFDKKQIKNNLPLKIFILLLSISFITRLVLFNENGFHFFPDESWYSALRAGMHKSVENYNPLFFFESIIPLFARPGYGILYFPALLIGELTGQEVITALIFNIIINVLCIVLIYLIIKAIDSPLSAFLASIFFIFSMSSVSYIRHSLPYDSSLLILLIGIYIFLKKKSFFMIGIITGFSFLTYPGNYFYFLSFILFLLIYPNIFRFYKNIYSIIKFLTGFLTLIFIIELISRTGINKTGRSYIETALHVSKTAVQGDWMPAIIFFKQYISAIDGLFGISLLIAAIITLFLTIKYRIIRIISFYFLLTYITLELMSFITHKTVLYGRTVRIFYIVIIILAGIGFSHFLKIFIDKFKIFNIPKIAGFSIPIAIVIALIIINWIPRFNEYKDVIYPEDFIKNINLNIDLPIKKIYPSEVKQKFTKVEKDHYYIINAGVFYPYYGMTELNCNYRILMEKLHAFSYKPYQFEGYNENTRNRMSKDIPKYQYIYCK